MLTEQRKRFVEEYLKLHCKNATQAAANAGYSPKTAASQASMILKDSEVQGYLEQQKKQIESELRQEFVFGASEAYRVMLEILQNPESRDIDKISVAKDFLDRAGFKPQEKMEISVPVEETAKELTEYLEQRKKGGS
nr:MAG TPA: terminase small subunit [Caudoviricetes sp.]